MFYNFALNVLHLGLATFIAFRSIKLTKFEIRIALSSSSTCIERQNSVIISALTINQSWFKKILRKKR